MFEYEFSFMHNGDVRITENLLTQRTLRMAYKFEICILNSNANATTVVGDGADDEDADAAAADADVMGDKAHSLPSLRGIVVSR